MLTSQELTVTIGTCGLDVMRLQRVLGLLYHKRRSHYRRPENLVLGKTLLTNKPEAVKCSTRPTNHDLYNLSVAMIWHVVQDLCDLCSTDSTPEECARLYISYGFHPAA